MSFNFNDSSASENQPAAEQSELSLKVQTETAPAVPVRNLLKISAGAVESERDRSAKTESTSNARRNAEGWSIVAEESLKSKATAGKSPADEQSEVGRESVSIREQMIQLERPPEASAGSFKPFVKGSSRPANDEIVRSVKNEYIVSRINELEIDKSKTLVDQSYGEINKKINDYQTNNKQSENGAYKEALKETFSSRKDNEVVLRAVRESSDFKAERPVNEVSKSNLDFNKLEANPVRMVGSGPIDSIGGTSYRPVNGSDRSGFEHDIKPTRNEGIIGESGHPKIPIDGTSIRPGKENGFDAGLLRDGGVHTMPGPVGGAMKPGIEERSLPADGRRIPGNDGQMIGDHLKPIDSGKPGVGGTVEQLRPGDTGRGPGNSLTGDLNKPGDAGRVPGIAPSDPARQIDAGRGQGSNGLSDQAKPVDSSRTQIGGMPNDTAKPPEPGRGAGQLPAGEVARAVDPVRATSSNIPIEPGRQPGTERPMSQEPPRISSAERNLNPDVFLAAKPSSAAPINMSEGQHPGDVIRARPGGENETRLVDRHSFNPNREVPLQGRPDVLSVEQAARPSIAGVLPLQLERKESPLTQHSVERNGREDEQNVRLRYTVGPGAPTSPEGGQDSKVLLVQPVMRSNLERAASLGDLSISTLPTRTVGNVLESMRLDGKAAGAVEFGSSKVSLEGSVIKAAAGPVTEADRRAGPNLQLGDLPPSTKVQIPTKQASGDGIDSSKVRPDGSLVVTTGRTTDAPVRGDVAVAGKGVDASARGDLAANGRANEAAAHSGQKVDSQPGSSKMGLDGSSRDNGKVPSGKVVESGVAIVGGIKLTGDSSGASGRAEALPVKSSGQASGANETGDLLGVRSQRGDLVSLVVAVGDRRTSLPGQRNGELTAAGVKVERLPGVDQIGSGGKRYLTGAEIALAAVIAAGGIRKIRRAARGAERVEPSVSGEQSDAPEGLEESAGIEGEQWYSMATMETCRRLDQGELQKSKSDQVLKRPVYLISKNETLIGIAEALFEDPDLGWLIADLNGGSVKQAVVNGKRIVELKDRQQIDLPVWQDIIEFYERRSAEAVGANLVTVVSDRQVNTELLNLMLSPVLAGGTGIVSPGATKLAVANSIDQATGSQPSGAVSKLSLKQLEQQLSEIAGVVISSITDQWPKPPATASSELQPKERMA
jgi:hypothetical protein